MIEILDSAKHLLAMKLTGSLTADDIAKAYKATEEKLAANERISFFAEVDDSAGLTLEGAFKDIGQGLKQLGNLSRFYRAAVVTDKGWLGAMARAEGLLFSSIDVRVFPTAERDKAFAWAGEQPEPLPKPEEPPAAIHFLPTTSESVFAYEVNGKLREKDVKAAVDKFKPYLEREGKINVLARMKNFGGFDLLSVFDDDLIKLKYKSLSKVDRYAVVGPSAWMRNFLELLSPMFSTKIKVFDAGEEQAAWEWVGAKQASVAGN